MRRIFVVITLFVLAASAAWAKNYCPVPQYAGANDLTAMMSMTRPWGGNSPSPLVGEKRINLPRDLYTEVDFGGEVFFPRQYAGWIRRGDSVFVTVIADCAEYTEYRLSRPRCGNPSGHPCFRVCKEKPPCVVVPPTKPPCVVERPPAPIIVQAAPPVVNNTTNVAVVMPTQPMTMEKSSYLPHPRSYIEDRGTSTMYVGGWWNATQAPPSNQPPVPCTNPGSTPTHPGGNGTP